MADSLVHTGGMGRESAGKWTNRHPKGASYSLHYTLLACPSNPPAIHILIRLAVNDFLNWWYIKENQTHPEWMVT